jgi:ABC-2 type transport system ATP-binding protein
VTILRLNQIHKRYGDVRALDGLDLTVDEGEVYGFLGRNGAGKSTALQIIMGITLPDSGEINLFDARVKGDDPTKRQHVGYVAQEQNFYEWMTAQRLGKFVSGFYPTWDDAEYKRLLSLLEVPNDRKILGFSGGMRAKLALSLALAHRPRLLLLDEPTAGMDAVSRREFIDIVRDDAMRSHRTTLFSSHLIDEVELAANKVGILVEGCMFYEGSLDTLRSSVKRFVNLVELGSEPSSPPEVLISAGQVLSDQVREGRREMTVKFPFDNSEALIPHAGSWTVEQPSLEDIFVAMVTKTVSL